MRLINSLLSVFVLASAAVFFSNCAAPKPTTSTSPQDGKYSEDLSVLRPKPEAEIKTTTEPVDQKKPTEYMEPKFAVNKQLNTVLDSINKINISRNAIDGFTIQVYSGKREEALNARKTLTNVMPDLQSEVQFTEPIFRVKVGKYYTRQEAQQDYADIKRYFPAAIIVPEKISVR